MTTALPFFFLAAISYIYKAARTPISPALCFAIPGATRYPVTSRNRWFPDSHRVEQTGLLAGVATQAVSVLTTSTHPPHTE